MRPLHILLLVIYCHFTMAGAAGAWVMKRDLRTEERSPLAVTDPSDSNDDNDGAADDGDASSPGDPDQCHRSAHSVHFSLFTSDARPIYALPDGGRASLRPIDITTPPPRA